MLFEGVDGIKIYDPRVGKRIVSDNPALILGYMIEKTGAVVGEGFWPGIAKWADYLDSPQVPRRTDHEIAQIIADQIREGGPLRKEMKP